ncbi:hypothetical protein M0802_000009 [Mischocyttarus mexicanus]|nr:hypothetical protein M0802_000009 [Mischocyttarus mexicanus]
MTENEAEWSTLDKKRLEEIDIALLKKLMRLLLLKSLSGEYVTICMAMESTKEFPLLKEFKNKLDGGMDEDRK